MAVREVFCGGEMDSWRMVLGSAEVSDSAGWFDAAFSSAAVQIGFSRIYEADFIAEDGTLTTIPNGETIHGMFYMVKAPAAEQGLKTFIDTTGRPTYRVALPTGDRLALQQNISTNATPNWQTICSTQAFNFQDGGRNYVAYYFDTGAKEAAIFTNGSFAASGTFTTSHSAGFAKIQLGPTGQVCFLSQILVTENMPASGARVWTRKATANGAVQEMTGGYTNLVKTALNDTTSVSSDVSNETATYVYQDVATPAGMMIGGVWMWQRAQNDGTAPTGLKQACRIGSTNYTTGYLANMMIGYNAVCGRFPVNPATSAPWSEAAYNAAEFGMQSAA